MKNLLILCGLVLLSAVAFAQGGSYVNVAQIQGAGNVVRVIPNAPVVLCSYPGTGGTPCTNLATTYMSTTLSVACPTNAQVVAPGSNVCSATADSAGNIGFFTANGTFVYYFQTAGGVWEGPYTVAIGTGAGLGDPGSNGPIKRTAVNTTAPAASADIIGLFSGGCSITTFLRGDGTCGTPAGGGDIASAPGSTQTIAQPPGTAFNVNNINGIRTAAQFNWTRSPADNLTTPGLHTVTLPTCPDGVFGTWPGPSYYTDPRLYYVYVSTVGTPEAIRVIGGTCNGDNLPGTLQFITANAHNAGYTVSSASSGIMEAEFAAGVTTVTGNSFSYKDMGGLVYLGAGVYDAWAPISFFVNNQTVLFAGMAIVRCNMDLTTKDCINIGDPAHYQASSGIKIINPQGISTTAAATRAFIVDFADKSTITNVASPLPGPNNGTNFGTFGYIVEAVGDQGMTLDGLHADNIRCDAVFCGSHVYAPGPFAGHAGTPYGGGLATAAIGAAGAGYAAGDVVSVTQGGNTSGLVRINTVNGGGNVTAVSVAAPGVAYTNASGLATSGGTGAGFTATITATTGDNSAVGWLRNMVTGNCGGNGVDWLSGNGVHISDSVIQGYVQFAVRGGLTNGGFSMDTIDNTHFELGSCSNPVGNIGTAGVIVNGGKVSIQGGEGPGATIPLFSNTGATEYRYWIYPKDGTGKFANMQFIGRALTNGAGTITITFADIPGMVTYDLLRKTYTSGDYSAPSNTTLAGVDPFAVATGLTEAGTCSGGLCTTSDTNAALSNYTVQYVAPTFFPTLTFGVGQVVLGSSGPAAGQSAQATLNLNDLNQPALLQNNTFGMAGPAIDSARCMTWEGGPLWPVCESAGGGNDSALILRSVVPSSGFTNQKGRLNFLSSINPGHIVTLIDSNIPKTLNGLNFNRPSNDAGDVYIGCDASQCFYANGSLTFGAPTTISSYINNIGSDGTSWKERLDATYKRFQISLALKEQAAPSGLASNSVCYADSTAHALKCSYNNGTFGAVPLLNLTQTWTAAQTFTPSANNVVPVTSQCGAGAAGSQSCFMVKDAAGTTALSVTGTNDTTSMTNIAISGLAPSTLTDGATITWDVASLSLKNATVTLGGNRTLNVSNLVSGGTYILRIVQDATPPRTLTLGTGCTWKVANGGAGAITLTNAANAIDVLTFYYDGANCYANLGNNYN